MPEPPPRNRLQIHLSTAIVLLFVAGALIWANTTYRTDYRMGVFTSERGWPQAAIIEVMDIGNYSGTSSIDILHSKPNFAMNGVIALIILFAVWFLCEHLIRRRAAQKKAWPMPEPPPRNRLQIHLSTAIVMMFVAGGLIWANITEGTGKDEYLVGKEFGWPVQAVVVVERRFVAVSGGRVFAEKKFSNTEVSKTNVAVDGLIAFSILFAVWFLCERLIRRRAAQKKA